MCGSVCVCARQARHSLPIYLFMWQAVKSCTDLQIFNRALDDDTRVANVCAKPALVATRTELTYSSYNHKYLLWETSKRETRDIIQLNCCS